jgi:hypothetical protein
VKTNSLILFSIFSLLISSCANYLYEIDEKKWNKNLIIVQKPPICDDFKSRYNFFGENKDSIKVVNDLINKKFPNLSIEEAAVFWALLQLKVRPDLFNPTSRFQIFVVKNNKPRYFDFSSKNLDATPLLYGLDTFLEKFSKKSLRKLSRMLMEFEGIQIPIGDGFSEFIQAKKDELKSNPVLYRNYFKAGLELRRGESLPALSYSNMLYTLYKIREDKEYETNSLLFSGTQDSYTYECNFDLNLYKKGIYLISQEPHPEGWTIGISDRRGNHIFMVAGNNIGKAVPIGESYFIRPKSPHLSTPKKFCYLKGDKNKMTILSTKGRDPAQYLYHIMNYKILHSNNLEEAQKYINFPRHLFLQNPSRILYESEKGTHEQLDKFLDLDFPLYHKQDLGRVYGHGDIQGKKSFILDHRGPGAVSCK